MEAQVTPSVEMKRRLRADLRLAMKEGRPEEAGVLRSLVAALDNAEAPPRTPTLMTHSLLDFTSGSAEVQRLHLDERRVSEVLQGEVRERERAAAEFERLGRIDRAQSLRAEARVALRYVT